MDRVLVARHAESDFNVQGVVSATPHAPARLTTAGLEQAFRLGEAIAAAPTTCA